MVPRAKLDPAEAGFVPAEPGWFVLNVRDARWVDRGGRGFTAPLTGWGDDEGETLFPELGVQIVVLRAGQPMSMHHWESD